MEKRRNPGTQGKGSIGSGRGADSETRDSRNQESRGQGKRARKVTEYGRQLQEKQKVKFAYGMREQQFRRFFAMAVRSQKATGEELLSLLERRLDNVVYRLKLASTRPQARQVVVHGHIFVNGKKVHSPSYLVSIEDVITIAPNSIESAGLLSQVVDKRLNTSVKVPDWLESDKKGRAGRVLRLPVRSDIQMQINESSIVELYSK